MATISAAIVKDLREKTGAGMMDCKAALVEMKGDVEAAIDWLRKKGLSKAAKKSGRIAAEGLVAVKTADKAAIVVEVNSETDFVARNEDFQKLASAIAQVALDKGQTDVEAVKKLQMPGSGTSVEEAINNAIATIGENMTLRRLNLVQVENGVIGHYVHAPVSEGLGKIAAVVALESKGDKAALAPVARQIAMHIAATSPAALDADSLDPAVVAREKAVLADKNAGKPPHVLEKIIESGLKTYYKEATLLDQVSIHADHAGKSIAQLLKDVEGKAGAPVKISGYVRYGLGEGIEKPQDDFAGEVAAAAKG